ncbi:MULTISPECIES: signal peptidase I [unclassified Nocardioides]|uniref:signal peptidase I n=1 Tax=unclassified Nocardioides TaxID=2615069 RepID=UPI001885AD36|nr:MULTISPECIES: signal peptidase I [unclassified Nocardioides]
MSTTAPVHPGSHRRTERPAATPSETENAGSLRRVIRGTFNALVTVILLIALVGFLFLAIGPHLLGYRTSTMLTGSMEPMIAPGDVIVIKEVPATELEVGDVVTYRIPVEDHRVETHRVVEVTKVDGSIAMRTKGDANKGADPWTAIIEGETVWVVDQVVPHIGKAIRVLHTPWVSKGVLWIAVGGMIALGFLQIWGRPDDESEVSEETDPDEDGAP